MKQLLYREASRIVILCLSGFVAGYFISAPFLGSTIILVIYLGSQLLSVYRLLSWLEQGQPGRPPKSYGLWRTLGESLYSIRKRQIASTRNIRKKFHRVTQLTHAIDEGIVILDRDFRLDWWNKGAEKMLGLQSEDRGIAINNLLRSSKFSDFLEQEEYLHALELPAKTDDNKWLSYKAHRVGQDEIILVVADISRLKKVEMVRKDFVGNVSHELRTPLTVLRGYLETLVDSGLIENPRALKAFGQMKTQVLRMQTMADDLITLSKVELQADASIGETSEIVLKPFFGRLVDEARVVSQGRHNFVIDCAPELKIKAVPEDFHSALGNLVVNAVRHNPEGVSITLSADEDENYLNIHVKDNGVGISADIIPRLTERFYRADTSRNSTNGGTGLGLAIVKHIVSRHGGQLIITSRLGEGSDFHCKFPLEPEFSDGPDK